MSQQEWQKETPDRRERVQVFENGGVVQRHEVVEHTGAARYNALNTLTSLVWLLFGILEALIALRIVLKLIAANPASPFAALVYNITDLFLWPFTGLTVSPSAGGMVLEIPAIIAMIVYALVAWVIIKVIWLFFNQMPTKTVSTYERDETIR